MPRSLFLLLVSLFLTVPASASPGDWPDWRGPNRDGRSPEVNLPDKWSPGGTNLLWKVPYGGRSTPVVFGSHLYLQNGSGEGKDLQERLMCLDVATGKLLWEYKFNIFLSDVPPHRVGWASPAVDPETGNVYVHGVGGTLRALTSEGKELWVRSHNEDFGLITTHGGRTTSPVIDGDLVIVSGPASAWGSLARGGQKFFAFDKRTGETVWVTPPPGRPYDTIYSPPIVAEIGGRRLLIAGGSDGAVHGLESQTGKHIWRYEISKRGINTGAVLLGDAVFVSHGEENLSTSDMGLVSAIRADSAGEITPDDALWNHFAFLGGYSTATTDGQRLYQIDNGANLAAFDPKDGRELWRLNLGTLQRASPVLADGKLYVGTVNGDFYIIRPGEESAEILDKVSLSVGNELEEIIASVAVADGRIFLVSSRNLYTIGKPGAQTSASASRFPGPTPNPAGEPALVQVVPADLTLEPGETARFTARLFDDHGNFIRETEPSWSLERLHGKMGADGTFVPGEGIQAGAVKATAGDLAGTARVRVIPGPPIEEDFESYEAGAPPPAHWINAAGKYEVRELDGSKVLVKKADNPFTFVRRVRSHFGDSDWSDYTVEVDVRGEQRRRRMGDVGVIAQRYKLFLSGPHRRLILNPWQPETDRAVTVPFPWEPDTWYRMKLRVDNLEGGRVRLRAKVWQRDSPEPGDWTIDHVDPNGNRQGSPGFYADANAELYFDNLKVTRN